MEYLERAFPDLCGCLLWFICVMLDVFTFRPFAPSESSHLGNLLKKKHNMAPVYPEEKDNAIWQLKSAGGDRDEFLHALADQGSVFSSLRHPRRLHNYATYSEKSPTWNPSIPKRTETLYGCH